MKTLPLPIRLVALMACALPASSSVAGESSLGFALTHPADACSLGTLRDGDIQPVMIDLPQTALDDPSAIVPITQCARDRGLRIIGRLDPPADWPSAGDPYAALEGWLDSFDRFLQAQGREIRQYELGRRPETVFDAPAYAFLVEKVASLIRSRDPGGVLIVGSLGDEAWPWLRSLGPGRIGPYIGGVALEAPSDLGTWRERLSAEFASARIWLHADTESGAGSGPAAVLGWHDAVREGIDLVIVPYVASDDGARVLLNLSRALPARFVTGGRTGGVGVIDGNGDAVPATSLSDPLGPESALLAPASGSLRLTAAGDPLAGVRAFDLGAGEEIAVTMERARGDGGASSASMVAEVGPVLVRYVLDSGPRGESELIGVRAAYDLTAAEIIARLRATETSQDRALDHYEAKATISYHYRAETLNESIDVASINRFYWRDGVGEYQETDLFVNGARWRGEAPSLPFVTAEKVKEVPLEIRLDQSYVYSLAGRETLDGEAVYRVAFVPQDPNRSLYSGDVWVDERTFVRRRLRLVQHNLKDPITSSTDLIDYAPISPGGGGGADVWLPVGAYRQMVFTVLGRAVAVERRVAYEDFVVNGSGFDTARELAYASGRPILRDDNTGYAYVIREENGIRVKQVDSLENVAIFGGLGGSSGGGIGSPFAGINYFDFDWRGTGTQLDVAYAGLLADVAWTDPSLAGSRWELSLEGRLTGLGSRFKRTTDAGREREEDLEVLEQRAWATIARPLGSYNKAEFQIGVAYDNYDRSDGTEPEYVLPVTRPISTATLRWKFHRSGTLIDVWAIAGNRFGWKDWGFPSGSPGQRGEGSEDHYRQWGIGLLKSFYPAKMQKISLGASFFDGQDMDRLSRFRIGDFRNARVRAYNGYDLTFDRGVTAQVDYLFTLPGGAASVDLGLEGALIENDEDFPNREYVAGGGAAVSFSGPWSTLVSVRAAVGLGSSLEIGTSGVSLRLVMIKTFDRWPW